MKKLFGGKKIIFIAVGAILVLALGGVLFAGPMITGSPVIAFSAEANPAQPDHSAAPAKAGKEEDLGPGMMYLMKERVINLADPGTFRYIKCEVVLEFDMPEARNLKGEAYKKRQEEFSQELASRRPKLDDILTMTLGSKTAASLSTSEGKEQLREELKAKMAEAAGEHKLVNVYFTQFIIQ